MNKVIKSMVAVVLAVTMMFSGAVSAFALDLSDLTGLLDKTETITAVKDNWDVLSAKYEKEEVVEAAICAVDTTFDTDVVATLKAVKAVLDTDLAEVKEDLAAVEAVLEKELEVLEEMQKAAGFFNVTIPGLEERIADTKEKMEAVEAAIEAIDAFEAIKGSDLAAKAEEVVTAIEAAIADLKVNLENKNWADAFAKLGELKEIVVDNENVQDIIDFANSEEVANLKAALEKVSAIDWQGMMENIEEDLAVLVAELKAYDPDFEIPEIVLPEIDTTKVEELVANLKAAVSGDLDAAVAALKDIVTNGDATLATLIINYCKHLTGTCEAHGEEVVVTLKGDANCDGVVNVMDILAVRGHVLGNELSAQGVLNADCTGEGSINVMDILGIRAIILAA